MLHFSRGINFGHGFGQFYSKMCYKVIDTVFQSFCTFDDTVITCSDSTSPANGWSLAYDSEFDNRSVMLLLTTAVTLATLSLEGTPGRVTIMGLELLAVCSLGNTKKKIIDNSRVLSTGGGQGGSFPPQIHQLPPQTISEKLSSISFWGP